MIWTRNHNGSSTRTEFAPYRPLQLDYVNVLLPAHFLVPWSHLGGYDRQRFVDYLYGSGECTEQWAHEAADLPSVAGPRRKPGDWHRSIPRCALEYPFSNGTLAVANHLPNYQRVYDLPKRVIPAPFLSTRFETQDAQRELLRRAARAMGVATPQDLADYFRSAALVRLSFLQAWLGLDRIRIVSRNSIGRRLTAAVDSR